MPFNFFSRLNITLRNILIVCGLVAGYIFIWFTGSMSGTYCMFKLVTGLPCPGCGGMRSTRLLLQGDWTGALWVNPLSVLLNAFIFISVFWLLYDAIKGRDSFFKQLKRSYPKIGVVIIFILIFLNWIWNIRKGL